MRNRIKWILMILVFGITGISIGFIAQKVSIKKKAHENLLNFPDIPLTTLDSLETNTRQWFAGEGATSMIIYFNSECDHCHSEVRQICQNKNALGDVKILMISSETIPAIKTFQLQFDLQDIPIRFLKIRAEDVLPAFGSITVPHMFIYSKDGKLLKQFKGETNIESVLNYVNQKHAI